MARSGRVPGEDEQRRARRAHRVQPRRRLVQPDQGSASGGRDRRRHRRQAAAVPRRVELPVPSRHQPGRLHHGVHGETVTDADLVRRRVRHGCTDTHRPDHGQSGADHDVNRRRSLVAAVAAIVLFAATGLLVSRALDPGESAELPSVPLAVEEEVAEEAAAVPAPGGGGGGGSARYATSKECPAMNNPEGSTGRRRANAGPFPTDGSVVLPHPRCLDYASLSSKSKKLFEKAEKKD